MEKSSLYLNKEECVVWLQVVSDTKQHTKLMTTLRVRVMAPFLYGEDFLSSKWRAWMKEAKYKIHIEKWANVEPLDFEEYDKIDSIQELLKLLSSQIRANIVDFQRFMNLAVKMDKQTNLAEAKALANDEISFHRLWERHVPSTERTKVALMMVVVSYVQFAGDTVRNKDHHSNMMILKEEEREFVDSFKFEGNAKHKTGDFADAVLFYTKALHRGRYCAKLYSKRSISFLNMESFDLALLDAKRAVTLEPSWPKAQHRYAEAMFELGHHSKAMGINASAICSCLQDRPNDPYLKGLQDQHDLFQRRALLEDPSGGAKDEDPSSSSDSDWSDEQVPEESSPDCSPSCLGTTAPNCAQTAPNRDQTAPNRDRTEPNSAQNESNRAQTEPRRWTKTDRGTRM